MQNNGGLSNFVRFLFVLAAFSVAWYYLYPKKDQLPEEAESPKLPNITREQAAAPASPAILAGKPFSDLLAARPPKPVEPPKPAVVVPTEPPAYIALGDDTFALKALLTTKGAGVQQLILTKFDEANRTGTKVIDAEGKARKLFLIPGMVRTPFLYIADESDVHELLPNLTAAEFAAGKKPGPGLKTDRLSPPSYTLLHYPAKDDPLRPLDKDGKLKPEDDRIPLATLGEQNWKLVSVKQPVDAPWEVIFETELGAPYQLKLRKTFTLDRQDYDFKLKVDIVPLPARLKGTGKFRYQIAGAIGMPIEGEWYTTTYRTAYVCWNDGNGTPRREIDDPGNIHYRSGGEAITNPGRFNFAATGTQFFASALAVDGDVELADQPWEYVRPTRELPPITDDPPDRVQRYEQERYFLFDITTRAVSKVFDPAAGEPISHAYAVYNGPLKVRLLSQLAGDKAVPAETVDRYLTKYHLDTLTDYHSPTWFGRRLEGIGWTSLIIFTTNLMHSLLGFLHGLVGSWGFSIILVTVCVRLCLFFPSRRQQTINAHMSAKIATLKPQIDKLNEKHKDDFLGLQQAKTALYRQAGIKQSAQFGGCLLLVLQMPILMGLYFCLQESVFFRLEPFLGWVPNLAAPDMTVPWSEAVPMLSTPWSRFGSFSFLYLGPYFNILPLAAVVLFYIQQRLTLPPPTDDIQAQQQAIMKYMLIFTALFFFKVAAGLCVYFIVGGLWAILERQLVPKPDVSKALAVAAGTHAEKPLAGTTSLETKTAEPKADKPAGFWGRMKAALEEAQKQAEAQRQIRNDQPNGGGGPAKPPRASAAERAQERKNKKKPK